MPRFTRPNAECRPDSGKPVSYPHSDRIDLAESVICPSVQEATESTSGQRQFEGKFWLGEKFIGFLQPSSWRSIGGFFCGFVDYKPPRLFLWYRLDTTTFWLDSG